ncbi:MAG: aromatic ring-hydroxylating dioxygenase subunit alpha [Marinobacter sp.]|uniref:aromatic ring-hydroxylating oxygenase subunit alpha n=1 Tax=Marinobacter sp. TaxID=50741 RepID=UPI003297D0DC
MPRINKDRYISSDWMQREWEQVWKKSWQIAVPLSDLKAPGDFAVYQLGPESILLSCTEAGEIKAFYNVCQHRGMRLVADHCGHSDSFRCPYHSWRYNGQGQLTYAPDTEGFSDGLAPEQVGLGPVRCELALGFAWISLDDEIEPLADYLSDMLPLLSHYEFENMTLLQDQTVLVNCNWKAVHDNFSELYHVPYLHPQHRRFVDCTAATDELYPAGHTRVCVPGGTTDSRFDTPVMPTDILCMQLEALGLDPADYENRVDEVQAVIRKEKRKLAATTPYYNNFSDTELSDVMQTNVFPNAIFSYQPEMLWLIRPRPHETDPNRCYLDKLSFERFPAAEQTQRPTHDVFSYTDVMAGNKSMTDTIDQDLSLLSQAQQGMLSDGFQELWLNDRESRIHHFHQRLDELIGLN